MGNPRQRHKARSSAHKVVRHSRHAKRNLRKMKPIHGPKALQDAWDKKKTLRQNYAAMGLVGSLKQSDSGGSEKLDSFKAVTHPKQLAETECPSNVTTSSGTATVTRGFGKILRDAEGNVIGVELPEERDPEDVEDGMRGYDDDAPKPQVVNELEKLAATSRPVPRFSSNGEVATLQKLIGKHGRDYEAMAKDRKLNEWQRTSGQLQRAIGKAGLM